MKERKNFINKVKQVCKKHKVAVKIIILIAFFIVGYLISMRFLTKPLNDNQLKMCEQVARNVYLQKKGMFKDLKEFSVDMTATDTPARAIYEIYQCKVIVKLQNSELVFSVNMTTTTITVKVDDILFRGKVIAKLQNGEFVMTRDMETKKAVQNNICIGIFFIMIYGAIILYIDVKRNYKK